MSKSSQKRTAQILTNSPIKLKEIPQASQAYLNASANCENIIGSIEVPIGLAGPLLIEGQTYKREVILPLATTEGCLVASVNRGCKAIYAAGGAKVHSEKIGITRAPVFRLEKAEDGDNCKKWLIDNFDLLAQATTQTSKYLELIKFETFQQNNWFFVKFYFDAKDAMGMNMAVIACKHMIKTIIEPHLGIICIALSGNLCTDKKPAKINIDSGRGFKVKAEVQLSDEILKAVLKTNGDRFQEVYESKVVTGSKLAESLGANCHHANMIAALYLATGQDLAHTVEGSLGSTIVEKVKNGLLVKVNLPAVVCGVVGGGTTLPKQKEALECMGLLPDPKRPGYINKLFAETIAGAVLAGEISLLAALASGDLSDAHASLRERN